MPREIVRAPGHDRKKSLGWLSTAWMEHFTVHGPGDVQGEAVSLDDELVGFTVDAYALGGAGRRLYDSAFLSRCKGRDKSGHASRFVLFESFGPCRFAGWAEGGETYRWRDFIYEYEPGEPMGRPVTYPFVRCLATESEQSGNTYDSVYFNLTEGPLAEGLPRDAAGLTRTLLPGGGEIVPSTAANASKDGGKETFVVFDETHLYVLAMLRAMYATVRRNLTKRRSSEPWSLETSTMYLPGEDSVAEDTHKLAMMIVEGKVRRARLLFDHREAPADVDLSDEAQLRAAIEEALGDFAPFADIDRKVDEFYDVRNTTADSRRYLLNHATGAQDAWIHEYEWAARADATKTVADRDAITLGFDGSRKRSRTVTDATALIACRVSDGHIFDPGIAIGSLPSIWEQPSGPAGDDWQVPVAEVLRVVDAVFDRFHVVGFYADPAKWEEHVAAWEAKYGGRLIAKATRDHPCEWWMTGGRSSLTVRALEEFHSSVVDAEMTHDGSSALHRHVVNARRRASRVGIQIAKEHPDSPRKIDAAVAAVLARKARVDALAKGVPPQESTFVPRRVR